MPKGIKLQLHDENGDPIASLSGITVVWFDTPDPGDWRKVTGNNGSVSTDASGWLKLDLSDVSGLSIDDWGFLVAYRLDGSDYRDSPVFAGRVQVSDVSGGTVIGPLTSWVRPANWLALPAVTVGSEKFAGLHAVYEAGSNFVALSATGAYTVNWGDGSGNINVASGVTAERNIAWADADPASDVGIADAAACTFTDSGDKVNRTAHGLLDGQIVAFSSITSTTGISTYTSYYVVGRTANTFQLSDTIGGSAKALTTDGSGQMYLPKYRQVVVTVVPNGSTITALNLHVKHSQSKLQQYSSQFLDMSIAFAALTDLRIGSYTFPGTSTQTIRHSCLQQCALVDCGVTDFSYMFNGCVALQSIPLLNTAAGTIFRYMFSGCTALQSAPVMNTAAGTSFSSATCSTAASRCNPSRCSTRRPGRSSSPCSTAAPRCNPSRCSTRRPGRTSSPCSTAAPRCNPSRCSTRRPGRASPRCSAAAPRCNPSHCSAQRLGRTSPTCSAAAPRCDRPHWPALHRTFPIQAASFLALS